MYYSVYEKSTVERCLKLEIASVFYHARTGGQQQQSDFLLKCRKHFFLCKFNLNCEREHAF